LRKKKTMPKVTVSIPKRLYEWLVEETKKRGLDTIQQTIRNILSEKYKEERETIEK